MHTKHSAIDLCVNYQSLSPIVSLPLLKGDHNNQHRSTSRAGCDLWAKQTNNKALSGNWIECTSGMEVTQVHLIRKPNLPSTPNERLAIALRIAADNGSGVVEIRKLLIILFLLDTSIDRSINQCQRKQENKWLHYFTRYGTPQTWCCAIWFP